MEIVTLLGLSKAFLDHVPRVVYSLYARATPLPPTPANDVEAANEAKWTGRATTRPTLPPAERWLRPDAAAKLPEQLFERNMTVTCALDHPRT